MGSFGKNTFFATIPCPAGKFERQQLFKECLTGI
jgi:hypothetical protein